jgi:hypothetical protein
MKKSALFERLHALTIYTHGEYNGPPGDSVWIEKVCDKLCALILANALSWEHALTIARDVNLWPVHCGGRCCAREDGGCFEYDTWQPFSRSYLIEQLVSDLVRVGKLVFAEQPPRRSRRGHLQRVLMATPALYDTP